MEQRRNTAVYRHWKELADLSTSMCTVRLDASKPLPASLVRKLAKARIAENAAQLGDAPDGATRRR